MGLSEPERMNGLYWSAFRLTNLRNNLLREKSRADGGYPYGIQEHLEVLEKESEDIWHNLIGNQTNPIHWFLGSDSNQEIRPESMSPWAVAVRGKVPSCVIYDWEPGKKLERSFTLPKSDDENDIYRYTTIPAFLRSADYDGPFLSIVHEIYSELETASYYLRRYNDSFVAGLSSLDKSLSRMNGACFCIMGKEDAFAKAYILSQIARLTFGEKYVAEKDVVRQWAESEPAQHFVSSAIKWSMDDLADLHVHLLGIKENSLTERLLVLLRLAGKRLSSKYQHDKLLAMCQKNAELNKKTNLKRIKEALAACVEAHEKSEAETKESYKKEPQDAVDIYRGY